MLVNTLKTKTKNVSYHSINQLLAKCRYTEKVKVLVSQSCPVLCNPVDYSPMGSSVHGIRKVYRREMPGLVEYKTQKRTQVE